ncbi:hypothetical protein K439DRAFT_1630469 [Ramaria rubella]|nr:hypothetical protein K439DRAFT_1640360 [Ramaria rubella]KAF8587712.1 hypothetical protein K439DRAFT_1630469 [Ramaria rubella]
MRCSEDEERDEDEYPAGYYSDGIGTSTTQWSIYAASQSHAQGSSSRQHTGYDGPSGTWLTENSYNPQAGGGYVGQSIHGNIGVPHEIPSLTFSLSPSCCI